MVDNLKSAVSLLSLFDQILCLMIFCTLSCVVTDTKVVSDMF